MCKLNNTNILKSHRLLMVSLNSWLINEDKPVQMSLWSSKTAVCIEWGTCVFDLMALSEWWAIAKHKTCITFAAYVS
jgi:hypothetical protein